MKIKETIERDCCDSSKDLKRLPGCPGHLDYYFCEHCGHWWYKTQDTNENGERVVKPITWPWEWWNEPHRAGAALTSEQSRQLRVTNRNEWEIADGVLLCVYPGWPNVPNIASLRASIAAIVLAEREACAKNGKWGSETWVFPKSD